MDTTYRMIFDEVRRGLDQLRQGDYYEARRTLEGVVLMDEFVRHYRRRDPHALRMAAVLRHLEAEYTPEGRLEWERLRLREWEQQQREREPIDAEDRAI